MLTVPVPASWGEPVGGRPLRSIVAILRGRRATHRSSSAPAVMHLALRRGLARLVPYEPAAPALLWSETTSTLRRLRLNAATSRGARCQAPSARRETPVALEPVASLAADAHDLARQLAWARAHGVEYLARARRPGCSLPTVEARLARTAERLVGLVRPEAV